MEALGRVRIFSVVTCAVKLPVLIFLLVDVFNKLFRLDVTNNHQAVHCIIFNISAYTLANYRLL